MTKHLFNRWREGAIGVLILVIIWGGVEWKRMDSELRIARLAYQNPKTKEVVREVKIEGPTRIVYRRIREPQREIVERVVYRDAVSTEKDSGSESSPVPASDILPHERKNRFLLSLGINSISPSLNGKALLVGYGINNRLDLMGGVIQKDHSTGWVFTTIRF
jgi:hypothetical protein